MNFTVGCNFTIFKVIFPSQLQFYNNQSNFIYCIFVVILKLSHEFTLFI